MVRVGREHLDMAEGSCRGWLVSEGHGVADGALSGELGACLLLAITPPLLA